MFYSLDLEDASLSRLAAYGHIAACTVFSGAKLLAAASLTSKVFAATLAAGFVTAVSFQISLSQRHSCNDEETFKQTLRDTYCFGELIPASLFVLQFASFNEYTNPLASAFSFGYMAGLLTSRVVCSLACVTTSDEGI